MQFLTKYLSRRWLTHIAGLAAVIGLALAGILDSRDIILGIVLIVASEGGSNVLDSLVHFWGRRPTLIPPDEGSHE